MMSDWTAAPFSEAAKIFSGRDVEEGGAKELSNTLPPP